MKRREFLACGAALALGVLPGWAAPVKRFKLGVITDEVKQDLEKALIWLRRFGLSWAELRNIWDTNVTELNPAQVQRARDLLARHGVRVSVLATAYLKTTLPGTVSSFEPADRDQFQKQLWDYPQQDALLERAIARARDFGTDKVRIFSFWRVADPRTVFDRVARELERAAAVARQAGIRLVLENEHSCNVATGPESAAMLKAVRSPALGFNWDPGNAYAAGETASFPDGYALLDKKRIWHMHIKDAQKDPATGKNVWRPVGGGKLDYLGQFRALIKDGFRGTMSLETHYMHPTKDKELASNESMEGLLAVLKRA